MSDIWDGAYWDEDGVLHIDIFPMQPVKQDEDDTMYEDEEYEEDSEEFEDEEEFEHTYATVDCGGECGGCVALIVDEVVVSGPPFHPHCGCSLSPQDIKNAEQHKSNLHGTVAPDRNVDTRDVEWLKKSLTQLDCYEPDTRAGESADNPNPYPNQKLFDAIEKFRKLQKIKERGGVKPGYWTEVKINQGLEKKKQTEKKDMVNIDTNKVTDMNFEQAYNKLKEREGGYTDGKNQKKDEPTNMGIKQSTLDRYSTKHPEKNLPSDVKYLTATQTKEIYKNEYWDNTRIPEIKNDRIRDAVFDMNVMGGAGKTVQRALNSFLDANLVVDGAIGSETIKSINAIPDSKVDEFMVVLKSERLNYLKGTENWETAKNGWTIRTNKY